MNINDVCSETDLWTIARVVFQIGEDIDELREARGGRPIDEAAMNEIIRARLEANPGLTHNQLVGITGTICVLLQALDADQEGSGLN